VLAEGAPKRASAEFENTMKTFTELEKKLITRRAKLQRELAVIEAKLATRK
jgi:hypothetical protein